MKAVRPPSPVDTSDLNSARSLAVLSVPPRSRVLCAERGDGDTGYLLGERGCYVATVEVERQSSSFVPPEWAMVIAGGVETADTPLHLATERFDAILLLDLLGYLGDPPAALAWACEHLRPGGRLIASFGNVAHGAVRLSLLSGAFPYTDTGLLDRARVRFYDRRSAEALLLDAGLRIDERLRVTRGLEETEIPTTTSTWPRDVVAGLQHDFEATTYEFVFVASRADSRMPAADASLAERLQLRLEELEAAGRAAEASATRMRAQVDARTAAARVLEEQASHDRQRALEFEAELTRRMAELHVRHVELRQLQADVADREAFIDQFRAQASSDRATLDALGAELQQVRALLETERAEALHAREELEAASIQQVATARAIAHADLTARLAAEHARLATASSELERVRAELSALRAHASSAGFRLVNRVSLGLRPHQRVYAALRSIVRRIADRGPSL